MIAKALKYITYDIWRIRLKDVPRSKSFLIKQLRVIILSVRGFADDNCTFRASALTFYTLLSIVPVFAMAFGIAKGFGFQKVLEKQLMQNFSMHDEVVSQVITFAQSLLNNTRGGMIAGIGVAVLFWSVIKVLGNIEKSFNEIWGIKQGRGIGRKFSDYLSIMLICPVLMIMSSSITVFLATQFEQLTAKFALLGMFHFLVVLLIKMTPYIMIWVLFTFVYIFMPNTKVSYKSGIIGGIVAGTIYQITQIGYIHLQVGVAKYNAIYGSFAALPLFLVWLQLSWFVVLLGAEVSFADQNVDTYEFEPDCLQVSHSFKQLLSMQILTMLIKRFTDGLSLSASEISHLTEAPIRLVRQIMYDLVKCGLVSEIKSGKYQQSAYQPGIDVDKLTVEYAIERMEHVGVEDIPVAKTEEFVKISEVHKNFRETLSKSSMNILLRDV
ncbi:MAG: YihY/virulence factor BrkB family protein [Candidatus Ancaeobacter aquaticus]|nr:YihY/virulence factor BrkB family protein [Candidatus Ancaeobacter aquaticus]